MAASGSPVAQPDNERKQTGRKIWEQLSTENKKILEGLDKTADEIALMLADLGKIAQQSKRHCDPGLETGEHPLLILDGLPPQIDMFAVAQLLAITDDALDESDISQRGRVLDPLLRPGERQLSPDSTALARLTDFTVTEKLRNALLGVPDTYLPPALQNCYLRPEPRKWEDRCATLQRVPALQDILIASRAMGIGRREVERMICDGLITGFAGTSLAGQVRAVDISPIQWPTNNGGGSSSASSKRPFAADYHDPKQLIRVYFSAAEDVDNLRSLMEAGKITIGGTSIYAKLTPERARSEFETRDAKLIRTTIQAARRSAQEGQIVRLVKAQVTVKHALRGRPNPYELGKALAEATGGKPNGIYAVISAGDRSGARPELGVTWVIQEFPRDSEVPTEFAERVARILKLSGREQQALKGQAISEVRAKRDTKVEITDTSDDMEVAEEEMTLNATKDCIADHLYFKGSLYLPMETKAGGKVEFQGEFTPLDAILDTGGQVIKGGTRQLTDIREIFPQPVTTKTFFTALEQMKEMGEIEFMYGEEKLQFEFLEIYHPLRHRLRDRAAGSA
jgi:hypothetical protein